MVFSFRANLLNWDFMRLGVERLIEDKKLQTKLQGQRLALLGHPASVTQKLSHSMDELLRVSGLQFTACLGPQHGMRGDKQYNMIESDDFFDAEWKLPVFSLYGKTRRPTEEMLGHFDTLIVDLQDVGARLYTYVATLRYVMEACREFNKSVVVLDRPNPLGRKVEGFRLIEPEWSSFVGAASIPMRHGLTIGELARYFHRQLPGLKLEVIPMEGYNPRAQPWPDSLAWVNPSPNIPSLCTARAYPGTVFWEATPLSDGRGTTRPLEQFGAPWVDASRWLARAREIWPDIEAGARLRACVFAPTFYKFKDELCRGIQIHAEGRYFSDERFHPYRVTAVLLKALRQTHPGDFRWRDPGYEYDFERLPVDLLDGGPRLRQWVEDDSVAYENLDRALQAEERAWELEASTFWLYP